MSAEAEERFEMIFTDKELKRIWSAGRPGLH